MTFGYESRWFGDDTIRTNLPSVAEDLLGDLHEARKARFQYSDGSNLAYWEVALCNTANDIHRALLRWLGNPTGNTIMLKRDVSYCSN